VNPDLALSFAKIGGSLVLLMIVLAGVGWGARRLGFAPEISRKLIHVSLGLYCLTFPWLFTQSWEVALVCALAGGLFVSIRIGAAAKLGEGLHAVRRVSYGELLFALSVALLFHLKDGHWLNQRDGTVGDISLVLYALPLLILTLSDAAAALVGATYGRKHFAVADGRKSWEGVVVFFVTAWLIALIAFLLLSDVPREQAVLLAFIAALFGALLEAASWRGLDNLFIPLGLYFMLANLIPRGVAELTGAAVLFAMSTAGLLMAARQLGLDRTVAAAAASLLFCIAIFSGAWSMLPVAAALGVYLYLAPRDNAAVLQDQAHNLVIALLGVAIAWYVLSDLLRMNTIFAYNVSFAALIAGLAGLSGARAWPLAVALVIGLATVAVRTLWLEAPTSANLAFTGLAALLMGAAFLAARFRDSASARPWVSTAIIAVALGAVALPFSPEAKF
jgi:dolichol kinase